MNKINLRIEDGEFFSLLGPSGCGKTTTLRLIAGLETATEGEIYLHGRPLGQTPAFKRPVNTVFQNYALFPHLNVNRNVAFGLEMSGIPKDEIKIRVAEALEMVQLADMGNRCPRQLSGGQQQRIALARALVNRPEVLLLDEPLGALDLKLPKDMQLELKQLQEEVGITFIYVTHDQEEALTMSDRIAVMNQGLVLQIGSPEEIYEYPRTRFVADFIGETNFLDGTVSDINGEEIQVTLDDQVSVRAHCITPLSKGQSVSVVIRPEKFSLGDNGMVTGDNALVLGWSGDVFTAQVEDENIDYVIPEEGAVKWTDNLCITKDPAADPNRLELAYQWIDFLNRPDITAMNTNYVWYASPNAEAESMIDPEILEYEAVYPPEEVFARLHWLENVGDATELYSRIWTEISTE